MYRNELGVATSTVREALVMSEAPLVLVGVDEQRWSE